MAGFKDVTAESVFPTQVGVIPIMKAEFNENSGVPHTGGGDPLDSQKFSNLFLCSPHRWG